MVPPHASCFDPLLLNGIFFLFVMLFNFLCFPPFRGKPYKDAPASQTEEQFELRSHAERGNDRKEPAFHLYLFEYLFVGICYC